MILVLLVVMIVYYQKAHERSFMGFAPRSIIMPPPEPRWYHITTHTYGAWLYGDDRSFRTRHHREHIEGDYKHRPPQGQYTTQLERSRKLLKQPPVTIPADLRPVVGIAMLEKLQEYGAQVLCLCVNGQHVHFLAKMPSGPTPRLWTSYAKREATFRLKALNWTGKLWAVRSKIILIKDRKHQLNVFHYILRHDQEGGWVWDFRTATTK